MNARGELLDEYGRAEAGTAPWTLTELTAKIANVRAEALREAADDLVSACPEHGDADEAWMDCPCEYADELRRKAELIAGAAP
ncbi:hypothetical protein [Streptomyces sp. NPDC058155]|uniref:hypothetical protein n=1 Tax=Streptomyces sp. NPDC058155 TaxID=3346359 RepID=UPI0036DFEA88